ncbi:hypothetical protein [Bremerella sp. P1]|uniref:hypothetical protein n=1 Tax=Bremerella sp. P1 TaxID=3026424 RepID=UPI002367F1F1|nr:hypothetical protein [Bremerella sp. P1]WDI43375.1 hypothetical protein PSR63_05375 [Bremerella sp. P1]
MSGNIYAPRICRECGKDDSEIDFKPKANICVPCNQEYMRAYRKRNREKIRGQVQDWKDTNRAHYQKKTRERYNTPEGKALHVARVERTPRSWLGHVLSTIRAKCKKPGPHDAKSGPQRDYEIDLDFVVNLFKQQEGRCAISGLEMEHKFNSLRSASIDRIDSSLGYVAGNVQIVCSFANFAKRHFPNDDMLSIVADIKVLGGCTE